MRVWDTPSGELLAERQVAAGIIATVTYSTDGARLAVAEDSGAVYAIDAETLAPAGPRVDVGRTFVSAVAPTTTTSSRSPPAKPCRSSSSTSHAAGSFTRSSPTSSHTGRLCPQIVAR